MKRNKIILISLMVSIVMTIVGCGSNNENDLINNKLITNCEFVETREQSRYLGKTTTYDYFLDINDGTENLELTITENLKDSIDQFYKYREAYGKDLKLNIIYNIQTNTVLSVSISNEE